MPSEHRIHPDANAHLVRTFSILQKVNKAALRCTIHANHLQIFIPYSKFSELNFSWSNGALNGRDIRTRIRHLDQSLRRSQSVGPTRQFCSGMIIQNVTSTKGICRRHPLRIHVVWVQSRTHRINAPDEIKRPLECRINVKMPARKSAVRTAKAEPMLHRSQPGYLSIKPDTDNPFREPGRNEHALKIQYFSRFSIDGLNNPICKVGSDRPLRLGCLPIKRNEMDHDTINFDICRKYRCLRCSNERASIDDSAFVVVQHDVPINRNGCDCRPIRLPISYLPPQITRHKPYPLHHQTRAPVEFEANSDPRREVSENHPSCSSPVRTQRH